MKKKILLALLLVLTACKPTKKESEEPVKKVEIQVNKKSDPEEDKKEEKKDKSKEAKTENKETKAKKENQEIFSHLKGKEFLSYLTNGSEHIIFYENGKFDGAWWSGDGVSMLANLYTGQFGDPKKIDEKTYAVKLKSLTYQSPTSGREKINGMDVGYTKSNYFDKKMIGDEYLIHLAGTSLADLDKKGINYQFDYNPDVANGIVNMDTISKKSLETFSLGPAIYMTELKTAPKRASKPGQNYYTSLIYGENYKANPKSNKENKAKNGPKKTTGINLPQEPNGQMDHATQIEMGDVFLSNYQKETKKAIGNLVESQTSVDFITNKPEAFYNIDYSKKYLDRLEDKTLSDVDFDEEHQPIIKILGEIIDQRKLKNSYGTDENQYVNIYEYTLLAKKRNGEKILISLDYMGDIDTATFQTETGTDLVKAWALPIATYTINHKDYGKIKVYKFAGGEGMQEAAFEKFGEGYGF